MNLLSHFRLLLLGLWLGAAVFFIAVAQSAFAVLPERELAGAVVNRTLAILNYSGLGVGIILLLTTIFVRPGVNLFMLWLERFLLLVLAAACAVGQFVIGWWLLLLRTEMGKPIDQVAADDPLRMRFNELHEYSTWILFAAMLASFITFLIISYRRNAPAKPAPVSEYDFSKEFKI